MNKKAKTGPPRRSEPTPFSRRLDAALDAVGLSNASFARQLDPDSGPQLVSGWRTRGKLSNESRARIRPLLPGISMDWLIDGVGDMHLPPTVGQMASSEAPDTTAMVGVVAPSPYLRPILVWDNPNDLPAEATVFLRKLDYFLSAGNGGPDPSAVEATDKVMPFRADFCAAERWTAQTHFTMRCQGESMEPTIQPGAPVVIATNDRTIRSGRVYAILIDGEPLLKRLDRMPGGRIRVRSDNTSPAYAPFEVDESAIEVIGRAVWTPVRL